MTSIYNFINVEHEYWYIYPCGYHWPSGYAKITLEATPRGLLWINNDTQEGMQVTGWPAKEAQSRVATGLRGWSSRNLHALAGGVIYSCMTTGSMLTRWVYSIYTSLSTDFPIGRACRVEVSTLSHYFGFHCFCFYCHNLDLHPVLGHHPFPLIFLIIIVSEKCKFKPLNPLEATISYLLRHQDQSKVKSVKIKSNS